MIQPFVFQRDFALSRLMHKDPTRYPTSTSGHGESRNRDDRVLVCPQCSGFPHKTDFSLLRCEDIGHGAGFAFYFRSRDAPGVSKFILRPLGCDDDAILAQTRLLIEQVLPRAEARWPRRPMVITTDG